MKEKQSTMKKQRTKGGMKLIQNWSHGKKAYKALARRAEKYPKGLLFPLKNWNQVRYNQIIKQASAMIDSEARYGVIVHSSHCLRHGGVGKVREEKAGTWALEKSTSLLRTSKSMLAHYSKDNDERLAVYEKKVKKYNENQKKKESEGKIPIQK
eukprot:GDKK01063022.1.p3 GENE.GDKK01063022.1~~GDKK01063022.1.p3  ORF type:complete len:154 (+),score=14.13 GDKK01063022.1:73-534(+)